MRALPGALSLRIVAGFSLAAVASGCTLEPTADGLEIVARAPYISSPVSVDEQPWNGEGISVDVERGNIEIVGHKDTTTISVRANTMTWARSHDDASAMRAATVATAKLERDAGGNWSVTCEIPPGDFGSALREATQCNVRVDVPAPEGVTHQVSAIARFGDVYLNRLQSGADTSLVASGIEVEGSLLRGHVQVYSYWADVEVEPFSRSTVGVHSASGDWYYLPSLESVEKRSEKDGAARFGATLRIPKDFTSEWVELESRGAAVEAFAFPDVRSGTPRGALSPASAKLVKVSANQGNATLLPWGESITTSRTGDFATDTREPWSQP
jgi:hypothetical protein